MGDLFGSKAASQGLIIYFDEDRRAYSDKFELWCRKLDDLQPVDFKRGMEGLEKKSEIDYREGGQMWPPSYAEFRALAFPKSGRDSIAHKKFEPVLGIEDQTAKAKRIELGLKNTAALLAMFPEPEPLPVTDENQLKDLAKLDRIRGK